MNEIFLEIQKSFIDLRDLITKSLSQNTLHEIKIMDDLNDVLSSTYVLLNQGFCESNDICSKCVENRDKLHDLIVLVDDFEKNEDRKEETLNNLKDFANEIPNILTKMEVVYLEKLAVSSS